MEKLLTIDEAAAILSLSKKTLYAYISQRKICFVKIQSSVRFRQRDLEDWINERAVKPIRGGREK